MSWQFKFTSVLESELFRYQFLCKFSSQIHNGIGIGLDKIDPRFSVVSFSFSVTCQFKLRIATQSKRRSLAELLAPRFLWWMRSKGMGMHTRWFQINPSSCFWCLDLPAWICLSNKFRPLESCLYFQFQSTHSWIPINSYTRGLFSIYHLNSRMTPVNQSKPRHLMWPQRSAWRSLSLDMEMPSSSSRRKWHRFSESQSQAR